MKVQSKVILLITLVACIFLAALYLIQLAEQQKTQNILAERKLEKSESFRQAIQIFESNLEVYARDYTQWDEMVDFVRTKDSIWAYENIDYSLNTYQSNAVWIFKSDLTLLYSVNNLSLPSIDLFPIEEEKIDKMFKDNYFRHFFVQVDSLLFELRSAPIQPSSDLDRVTKPAGFFFTARLWDKNFISKLELHTSSQITLKNTSAGNKIGGSVTNKDFTIKVVENLPDWKGESLIRVISQSDFPILKTSAEVFNKQIISLLAFSMLVLLIVSYFLIKNVSNPLKVMAKGLEEYNPALLVDLAKDKSEFGKLSQLIIQFFKQKEQLIDEIQNRKFIENSLVKSEEKYRKIFENVQDIFYQTDLNGCITSISPSIHRYSEYTPDEVIGRKITDFYLDPKVRDRLLTEIYKNGEVVDFEIKLVRKSGKQISCSVNAHFLYDDNKKIIGMEGSLRDITERKTHEEKIVKLSSAIEQSPIAVVITDINGNIEYVNPRFIDSSGYTYDELIGKKPSLIKSGLTQDKVYKELWATISEGKEWSGELQNRNKNGVVFWEMVYISPIKNSENVITNFLGIKEDITEKKKIIQELKSAKEKAEDMSNLKSSFLANMSHELRTPMMGILGNAEIISISTEDTEIKDMASSIYTSGQRLINTLNLILDLSRIEANKESLDLEKLEVVSIISDTVNLYSSAAFQKNINLNFICNRSLVYSILDERLFREILNNLINNAIKFTNTGGITVTLEVMENNMVIKILDTGIGIPAHSLGLVFDEFRQVSEGYGRNFEGTGLGLTITKKFVEKLNGKISVKSQLDIGSEFTIEFGITNE
jgi:PAS domain S-box-containing protein